jgi:hypothetical protein
MSLPLKATPRHNGEIKSEIKINKQLSELLYERIINNKDRLITPITLFVINSWKKNVYQCIL